MARVNKANFRTYRDGETVTASEFNKIKDIFPEAINHIEDTLRDGQRLVDIENVNKEQDERLDSHDERQAQTEQHLEQLDTRCDEQDEVLANHEARITTATSENSRQDEVISNINERLREVEDNNADIKIVTVFANNVQKVETFVAEEGQQEFQLKKGHYIPGQNRIQMFVDGVQQTLDDGFMEINSATIRFTEPLKVGMKVTAHYFTEDTSDDLTDIMETIKEGPAILEGLVEKAEKIKADSILVQPTKPLPEDNCDIWFDTSEDDYFVIENMELTSVEGVALVQRISEVGDRLDTLEQMNYIIRPNGVDDTRNIQRLLDDPSIKTITFTPGTFYISEELQIGSDVTLKLQPNTILKKLPSHVGNIIVNKNIYATGYTGNENITIDGGIFDFSNVGSGDSIFFLHCENVSVKNARFINQLTHAIEFNACNYYSVENCYFYGSNTEEQYKEAIQIDVATETATGGLSGQDGTYSKNGFISRCKFLKDAVTNRGWQVGIGLHNLNEDSDDTYDYLTVSDCEFDGCHIAVNLTKHHNFTFENNVVKNCEFGLVLADSHKLLIANNRFENHGEGVIIKNCHYVQINRNELHNMIRHGIYVRDSSTFTEVGGNRVHGFGVNGGNWSGIVIQSADVTDSCEHIHVYDNVVDNKNQTTQSQGIMLRQAKNSIVLKDNMVRGSYLIAPVYNPRTNKKRLFGGSQQDGVLELNDVVENYHTLEVTYNFFGVQTAVIPRHIQSTGNKLIKSFNITDSLSTHDFHLGELSFKTEKNKLTINFNNMQYFQLGTDKTITDVDKNNTSSDRITITDVFGISADWSY